MAILKANESRHSSQATEPIGTVIHCRNSTFDSVSSSVTGVSHLNGSITSQFTDSLNDRIDQGILIGILKSLDLRESPEGEWFDRNDERKEKNFYAMKNKSSMSKESEKIHRTATMAASAAKSDSFNELDYLNVDEMGAESWSQELRDSFLSMDTITKRIAMQGFVNDSFGLYRDKFYARSLGRVYQPERQNPRMAVDDNVPNAIERDKSKFMPKMMQSRQRSGKRRGYDD